MKIRITKWWLGAALGLFTAAIQPAMADEWNKETRINISAPLQIPGKVLPPGKYVFRLLDSQSNRSIVRVYSVDADGNETFLTTILAVSAYRLDTPDKPIINLEERHTGTPEAIHTWFYPGDNYGWEFVYPKSERLEVAVNQPTPAPAPVEAPPPPSPEEAAVPEPAPEVVEASEVVIAQNEPSAPSIGLPQEPEPSADRELPQTAGYSVLQLAAAMGMLALGFTGVLIGSRQSA